MKPNLGKKTAKILFSLIAVASLVALLAGCSSSAAAPLTPQPRLRVATTTSLYDTGLWGYLEPMFEEKYGVELDILYTGSGQALEYGRRGDVDVITVHDKPNELKFVSDNYGVERVPFAYNYFLIVGPASDPAGIKGMSPEEAFKKLMETGSGTFVSRGDNSGTHSMEKTIWQEAGFDYATVEKAGAWYVEAGSGMGPTCRWPVRSKHIRSLIWAPSWPTRANLTSCQSWTRVIYCLMSTPSSPSTRKR